MSHLDFIFSSDCWSNIFRLPRLVKISEIFIVHNLTNANTIESQEKSIVSPGILFFYHAFMAPTG